MEHRELISGHAIQPQRLFVCLPIHIYWWVTCLPSFNIGYSGNKRRSQIVATGGTTQDYSGWRVHTITSTSNFVISSGFDVIQFQLLGSGGGGGCDNNGAGGGGAGGLVIGERYLGAGTYSVVISSGGAGYPSHYGPGNAAPDNTFMTHTALGGGAGGAYGASGTGGGCGGGGGFFNGGGSPNSLTQSFYSSFVYTGNSGGNGGNYSGGGGGGIGSNGTIGSQSGFPTYCGNGGAGLAMPRNSWLSSTVTRGGGGGGGGGDFGGTASGGAGIGRGMLDAATVGDNATANHGAGGGGGWSAAGNGSTGICFIRYRLY